MITIVKGDDVRLTFNVKNDGKIMTSSDIAHLYFSSNSLNLTTELTYNSTDKDYLLEISKAQTALFNPGKHSYDITMDAVGGDRNTIIYEDTLDVVAKHNTVVVTNNE